MLRQTFWILLAISHWCCLRGLEQGSACYGLWRYCVRLYGHRDTAEQPAGSPKDPLSVYLCAT